MRKILFRGKRIEEHPNKWAEGFYTFSPSGNHYITETVGVHAHVEKVYPETVGQYTGIVDAFEEKIFEGDIIEWSPSDDHLGIRGVVNFEEGGFCANNFFLHAGLCYGCFSGRVIGNIHDNPELIAEQ